jgi:hypothetical protein
VTITTSNMPPKKEGYCPSSQKGLTKTNRKKYLKTKCD